MLKKKLRGKSKFLRKMNELMEIYSRNQDTAFAYRELLGLESMIRYEGEQAMFDLNKASLLYDMGRYREAETVLKQIPSINPTFDAMCESLRFKLLKSGDFLKIFTTNQNKKSERRINIDYDTDQHNLQRNGHP